MALRSVSIPAISSGVYGFPIHLCAKTIVEAAAEFCKKHKSSKVREIRLTNIDQRACDAFLTVFRMQFGVETVADRFDSVGSVDSLSSMEGKSEVCYLAENHDLPTFFVPPLIP